MVALALLTACPYEGPGHPQLTGATPPTMAQRDEASALVVARRALRYWQFGDRQGIAGIATPQVVQTLSGIAWSPQFTALAQCFQSDPGPRQRYLPMLCRSGPALGEQVWMYLRFDPVPSGNALRFIWRVVRVDGIYCETPDATGIIQCSIEVDGRTDASSSERSGQGSVR